LKRLLAWLAGALLLLALAVGGLFILAVESAPLVVRDATISPLAIAQARWLLRANDPRRLRQGDLRQTGIPAGLIDEGSNYVATRFLHGRGSFQLASAGAEFRFTVAIPGSAGQCFLNLRLGLREQEGKPQLDSVRVGALSIPPALAETMLALGIRLAGYEREWQLGREAVQGLRFEPARRRIIVAYAWEPALLERFRSAALDREDLARLRSAHEMLAGLLDQHAPGSQVALPAILHDLLDVNGSDQLENRRAAIFVLAAYLSERKLATVLPEAANWPALRPIKLMLAGRIDSAQHFVISAALTAWAGEPLAEAIGVYKELADARHGSGFSFADLAADRAGTAFGELLLQHPERIDRLLRAGFVDGDIIPPLADLPEYLGTREFQQRYGQPGSAAYRQLTDEIERRLHTLPLYRKPEPA